MTIITYVLTTLVAKWYWDRWMGDPLKARPGSSAAEAGEKVTVDQVRRRVSAPFRGVGDQQPERGRSKDGSEFVPFPLFESIYIWSNVQVADYLVVLASRTSIQHLAHVHHHSPTSFSP